MQLRFLEGRSETGVDARLAHEDEAVDARLLCGFDEPADASVVDLMDGGGPFASQSSPDRGSRKDDRLDSTTRAVEPMPIRKVAHDRPQPFGFELCGAIRGASERAHFNLESRQP
jgi:hypothetical protein